MVNLLRRLECGCPFLGRDFLTAICLPISGVDRRQIHVDLVLEDTSWDVVIPSRPSTVSQVQKATKGSIPNNSWVQMLTIWLGGLAKRHNKQFRGTPCSTEQSWRLGRLWPNNLGRLSGPHFPLSSNLDVWIPAVSRPAFGLQRGDDKGYHSNYTVEYLIPKINLSLVQ